jgi:hypothetical protein
MSKSFFTMLAAAGGLALSGLAAAPANAMEPVRHGAAPHGNAVQVRHLERHFDGDHHSHFRRHFGPRIYIAPVYGYSSYHNGCYWLKRKALYTGSRYWWHRYNECRWG